MSNRKAPKRAKNRGAPVPHVEDGLSRLWQLTLDAYAAKGIAVGPMRRDIVRVIRARRRRKR